MIIEILIVTFSISQVTENALQSRQNDEHLTSDEHFITTGFSVVFPLTLCAIQIHLLTYKWIGPTNDSTDLSLSR